MTSQIEIFSTDIVEHSGLKYRIEMRNNGGLWQQRHIWYPAPATFVTEITADEWITSGRNPPPVKYWPSEDRHVSREEMNEVIASRNPAAER